VYQNEQMYALTIEGYLQSAASDINASGQIIGWAWTQPGVSRPYLYEDGAVTFLDDLVDPELGWTFWTAQDINDVGQITGYGLGPGGNHAYLLTPIPEPGTLAVLAAGIAGVLTQRRRQS
jgi:probable HAF family extracellular repeat protein